MKALLVVDVQAGYIEKYPPALLKRINVRIEKAVSDKELIVYIKTQKRSGEENTPMILRLV